MRSYLAFIHKDPDSDYTVTFPDFPTCITAGGTLDEARDIARGALPFHVEGLLADGEQLPDPMSLEQALMPTRWGVTQLRFLLTSHSRIRLSEPTSLCQRAYSIVSIVTPKRRALAAVPF